MGPFLLARKWLHGVQVWLQSSHLPARRSDFRASTKVHVSRDFDVKLDLEHTLDAGSPVDHRVQVWSQSAICLREKALLVRAQKCMYHVTVDLDLDLEHTLDAG